MPEPPLPDIHNETRRLIGRIGDDRLPLRLIGGMAIRLRVGDQRASLLPRDVGDIDFVAARKSHKEVSRFLVDHGYEPEERFNAINREQRLLFHDRTHGRQVDIFVGTFEMCHRIPFAERMVVDPATLPNAELLMMKLQIVEVNAKDLDDAMLLLSAFPVDDADADAVNGRRIAELCADDWGLWRTLKQNLEAVATNARQVPAEEISGVVPDRVAQLEEKIEGAPKTRRWRMRARIGDRKRWYELPEEVAR